MGAGHSPPPLKKYDGLPHVRHRDLRQGPVRGECEFSRGCPACGARPAQVLQQELVAAGWGWIMACGFRLLVRWAHVWCGAMLRRKGESMLI